MLTLTFLELNGILIDMDTEPAFELVLSAAQSKLSLADIAGVLRAHIR